MTTHSGYTIVEAIVAIGILLVGVTAPLVIANRSTQLATDAINETTAFFLAQEGIELVVSRRSTEALELVAGGPGDSWDFFLNALPGAACTGTSPNIVCEVGIDVADNLNDATDCSTFDAPCNIYFRDPANISGSNSFYVNDAGGAGTQTQFNRVITLEQISDDPHSIRVESAVSWTVGGTTDRVSFETVLFDIYEGV